MSLSHQPKLVHFLETELDVPKNAISIAVRHQVQSQGDLPMLLWQYGLITLEQLDKIFNWMETEATYLEPS